MKMNILKDESKELEIEFETSDLTIPDLLAAELQKNPDVSFAGVIKEHPNVGYPRLVVKSTKKKAGDILEKALEGLSDEFSKLKDSIKK